MTRMHEGKVLPAELGWRVAERLREFEARYDGGCGHDADQWAAVGALRSSCLDCMRNAGPLASWERPGPCDVCGRAMTDAPTTPWAAGTAVGVVAVCLRLCESCTTTEVLAVGEPEMENDVRLDRKNRDALQRRMAGRAWAPSLVASAGNDLPCCEQCWTFAQTAATGKITEPVPLHRDCHASLQTWAASALARDRSTLSRAERTANARAVLVLATAVLR